MKKIIFILALVLISFSVFSTQEVPAYLKDAVITVTLTNGEVYTYSANTHAVVLREAKEKAAALAAEQKKNRIAILGGSGFDGNTITASPTQVTISDKRKPVFGLLLGRDLADNLPILGDGVSVYGIGLTNSTFLFGAGKSF